ncbi:MAG TPA: nucleotidyltransferase domain-containing protein [Chloroflexi bacterium]|nr:nucleotidyltransferase domain-containing protein [Chloroflexota bacterium]
MKGIGERRKVYRRALERALERLVAHLTADPAVQRIILFGSYARGRRDLRTDLDVLVVKETPLGFVDRVAEMYRMIGGRLGVDADILVYTPDEWARMKETAFGRRILEGGRVLYEKRTT